MCGCLCDCTGIAEAPIAVDESSTWALDYTLMHRGGFSFGANTGKNMRLEATVGNFSF